MLYAEGLFRNLLEHLKVSDAIKAMPFTWSASQKHFVRKEGFAAMVCKVRFFIATAYGLLITSQALYTYSETSSIIMFHTIFYLLALFLVWYTHFTYNRRTDDVVTYLNQMLKFEKHRNGSEWRPGNRMMCTLTKLFIWLAEVSVVGAPCFYHLDMFLNPCMPIHPGAYVLLEKQCNGKFSMGNSPTWTLNETLTKLSLLFLSLFNWTYLISGATFEVSIGLLLKCHCLRNYVALAMVKLKKSQTISTCMIYRELQVMTASYREIYSRSMTQVVLACFVGLHIISVYACVKFGLQLPLPMFLAFANIVLVSMGLILYVYTCLAKVYEASTNLILDCKTLGVGSKTLPRRYSWFKRLTASCRILRIYIGYSGFVDELTPLIVEDFVTSQTAGLMCL